MKIFTLVLVLKKPRILLGLKKRGLGVGLWNGFGGKVETGETVVHAAIRELQEESGITVKASNLLKSGIIDMYFSNDEGPYKVHVFTCSVFEGVPSESEEMKPQWFDIEAIPYHSMWKEARIWYPVCLSGKQFFARFYFDCSGEIERSEISEAAESEKMA